MQKLPKRPAKISIMPGDPPGDLRGLLHTLFWKAPELAGKAEEFLSYVKEWQNTDSPYTVDGWDSYCRRTGLSQSQYSNMLKRLRNAGMVAKRYSKARGAHELALSDRFSAALFEMGGIWREYAGHY